MNKHMQGICPNCGSDDLNYGNNALDGIYMGFEWECGECGTIGVEWYVLEFMEHFVEEANNKHKEYNY